jgi:hypothetical protein
MLQSKSSRSVLNSYMLLIAVLLPFWCWFLLQSSFGVDFEIVRWSSRYMLEGHSPYGAEATQALQESGIKSQQIGTGSGYPLPFYIVIAPLAMLPYGLGLALWLSITALVFSSFFRIEPYEWSYTLLLVLLYFPLHRAVLFAQPTVLYCALIATMIVAIQRRWVWILGLSLVVLCLKPQSGVIFALYGLYWAWNHERRAALLGLGVGLGLLGISFLFQTNWMQAWLDQLQTYGSVTGSPSTWFSLILLLPCMRVLPWYANLALLQVLLFPLTDLYSFAPLLFVWLAIGGRLALVGTACSWLWILLGLPNSTTVAFILIVLPLVLASYWYTYQKRSLWTWPKLD